MTTPPVEKPAKPAANALRLSRESDALRANLLKRKAQTRQREAAQCESAKPKPAADQ